MGMLEQLLAQAGGKVDLAALGAKAGLAPEQTQALLGQLLPRLADPDQSNAGALADVASKAGVSAGALGALLPQLMTALQSGGASKDGMLGQLLAGMSSPQAGGAEGLLGNIAGMLDQDGDGNPLDDIMGMFGRK